MLLIGTTLARVTHTHGAWQDEAAPPVNRGLILAHLKLKVSGVKISRLTCGCVHPLDWELLISESCKTVSGPECFFSVQIPGSLSLQSPNWVAAAYFLNVLHSKAAVIGDRRMSKAIHLASAVVLCPLFACSSGWIIQVRLRIEWAGPGRRFCYGRTFFFLIFKKIKISKIYVRFENFQ